MLAAFLAAHNPRPAYELKACSVSLDQMGLQQVPSLLRAILRA